MQLPKQAKVQVISVSSCSRYLATIEARDNMLQIYHIERQKSLFPANRLETQGFVGVAWSKRDKDLRLATIKPHEVIFWHPANVTQILR